MSGRLQLEQEVGPFGRPAFDFVWDKDGFSVKDWPLGKVKLPDFDFSNIRLNGNCPGSGIFKIPIRSKVNVTPGMKVTLEPVAGSEQKRPTLTITLKGSLDLEVGSSAYSGVILSAPVGDATLSVPLTEKGFTWDMLADAFVACLQGAAASVFQTLIEDPKNLAKLLGVKGVEWGLDAVRDFLLCRGASREAADLFVRGASGAAPITLGVSIPGVGGAIIGGGTILLGGIIGSVSADGSRRTNGGGGGDRTKPRPPPRA